VKTEAEEMSSTREYTLVLSKEEFYDTVVQNIRKLPLQELFFIDDWYIGRLIRNWTNLKFEEDYRRYIFGLLMVSDNTEKLDSELCLWNISRNMVDELIASLAEGFYYDEMESIMGENLWFEPFAHPKEYAVDKEHIIYFLDVIDTIYNRVDTNEWDTVTWLRYYLGEDYLT
jgi:hypothetical protein